MRNARKHCNGILLRGAYGGDIRPSIKRAHAWGVQLFTTTTETSDEIIISRPIPVHPRRAFCLRSLLGAPLIASAVDHYKDAHVPTGTNSTTGPLDTGIRNAPDRR